MRDDNAEFIAESLRDGSYYADARQWYSTLFHTPIAERSYYIIVIILSLINAYFSAVSFIDIFPITTRVPFVTYSENIWEDLPRIKHVAAEEGDSANIAVMKLLLKSYIEDREAFDVKHYELRYRSVGMQSTPNVFEKYQAEMNAANPYSPYRIYTNKAVRTVNIDSINYQIGSEGSQAHIVFDASVVSSGDGQEISHTKWQADIAFKYTEFSVDQSLDEHAWVARTLCGLGKFLCLTDQQVRASGEKSKVLPMTFIVSDYQVRELLE